jgi:hypothetical protein
MINESKGTPDIIREIINENSKSINLIILNGVDESLNLEINKSSNQRKGKVLLNCILNINFYFADSKTYNGDIKFYKCIESGFKNCEINIYLPNKNIEKISVYKSLIHELTHLYELYQIKDFFKKSSWMKSMNLYEFDKLDINSGLVRYFRDIFYASLPHEIRANLSSLEVFLIGLRSKDEKYLRDELEKTTEWSRYRAISEFNPENYLYDLINRYGLDFTISSFNLFNKVLEIRTNLIINKEQLLKYFKRWKVYFSDISKDYKYKIENKIKKIIEVDENKYGTEIYEDKILKYSDYLKETITYSRNQKLDDILSIDYQNYFENWNPVLNKEVLDYIELNKKNLCELWDNQKSEEENIEFLTQYFTEYPDEMNSIVNSDKIKSLVPISGIKNAAPVFQNIGGVRDFKSF